MGVHCACCGTHKGYLVVKNLVLDIIITAVILKYFVWTLKDYPKCRVRPY